MSKLDELKQRLLREENKNNKQSDGSNYAFWNMPEGDYATVRFLPDGDSQSEFFWVDKLMIKLPFAGIRGKSTKPVDVQVPCMQMYGETCPITEEIKPLWKTDEDTARIYYRKKSFVFHGFVRRDGIKEQVTPENPIRRFVIGTKLFNIIRAGLLDPEMEDFPADYEKGADFNIYKTKAGDFADYTTSRWARKTSSLTESELEAINTFGLPKLTSYLPKKPTPEALNVIMEMFAASMAGEAYDIDKYGQYYRPFGLDEEAASATPSTGAGTHKVVTATTVQNVVHEEPAEEVAPVVAKKASTPSVTATKPRQSVQDLLAQIKAKKSV